MTELVLYLLQHCRQDVLVHWARAVDRGADPLQLWVAVFVFFRQSERSQAFVVLDGEVEQPASLLSSRTIAASSCRPQLFIGGSGPKLA